MALKAEQFTESAEKEIEVLADKFEKQFDIELSKQINNINSSYCIKRPSSYTEAVNDIIRERYLAQGWKEVYIMKVLRWGASDLVVFKR